MWAACNGELCWERNGISIWKRTVHRAAMRMYRAINSGSAEFSTGAICFQTDPNGSGYYSDAYFPGVERERSPAQGVSTKLSNDIYIGRSVGYNRTAPKSYAYDYTYRSETAMPTPLFTT